MKLPMKLSKFTLLLGMLFLLVLGVRSTAQAQDSCTYRLRIFDSFGDDWDNSQLYIRFGNNAEQSFTHIDLVQFSSVDSAQWYDLRVRTGDSIVMRYDPLGFFQNEVRFTLYDLNDNVVFDSGRPPTPASGVVFRGLASCRVACRQPQLPVGTAFIGGTNAILRWGASNSNPQRYEIEYDTLPTLPLGTGRWRAVATDTFLNLGGLVENTPYRFNVRAICSAGDTSPWFAGSSFRTFWMNDVAAIGAVFPKVSCATTTDTLKIIVRNLGAMPQTLFKFNYSVNGVGGNIPFPTDGVYTGVLSRDSVRTLTFETLANFPDVGEYNIAVWVEVEGDRNRSNDTFRFKVVKPRLISTFPYFQDFEAGTDTWFVSDSIGNSTWQWGQPRGTQINTTVSGRNVWTTGLTTTYNNSEFSYVVSPCLDFSSLAIDPSISFNINYTTETNWDGSWLELSKDGGRTWEKLGNLTSGIGWYNANSTLNNVGLAWTGTTNTGWRVASHVLTGVARLPDCRVRFAFKSDGSGNTNDGVAFDNVLIGNLPRVDAMAMQVANANNTCANIPDSMRFSFRNLSVDTIRSAVIAYQFNGGTTVLDTIRNIAIAPNGTSPLYTSTRSFTPPTGGGSYPLVAWVQLLGDNNRSNDTIRTTVERPISISTFPYVQDFESGRGGWTVFDSVGNTTWDFGTPRVRGVINSAASGVNVWTTWKDSTYKNNDFSYVMSPCFDFSSFTTDPRISMSIISQAEQSFDGAWVEVSNDGGLNWNKVGMRNTGVNWYTDTIATIRRPVWARIVGTGWRVAQNTLTGTAGRPNVRIRVGYRSDVTGNTGDGFAFDNVVISQSQNVDMAAGGASNFSTSLCGMPNDSVTIQLTNLGDTIQRNFTVFYSVNGGAVVSEDITGLAVAPRATVNYRFRTAFNSTTVGDNIIRTWVRTTGDTTRINDTSRFVFNVPAPVGIFTSYNFNNLAIPAGWTIATGSAATFGTGHGLTNGAMFRNLFTANANMTVETNKFGPIKRGDSLTYDYRYVTFTTPNGGHTLSATDTLAIQVAFDCSNNFFNIDTITRWGHITSDQFRTRRLLLGRDSLIGRVIRIRFRAVRVNAGDYFIDIDNVNFISCPENFGIVTRRSNTPQGQARGTAVAAPRNGLPPFTYSWSNGRTTDSISSLAAGRYTVTITDFRGCTDTASVLVEGTVGTFDPSSPISQVKLMPNPTSGQTIIDVEFAKTVDARVQVLNIMGQELQRIESRQVNREQYPLDLSEYPAGVYLVRITAENRSFTAKLVKQ